MPESLMPRALRSRLAYAPPPFSTVAPGHDAIVTMAAMPRCFSQLLRLRVEYVEIRRVNVGRDTIGILMPASPMPRLIRGPLRRKRLISSIACAMLRQARRRELR